MFNVILFMKQVQVQVLPCLNLPGPTDSISVASIGFKNKELHSPNVTNQIYFNLPLNCMP